MRRPISHAQQLWTDQNKLLHDTLQQLVTISSGSILAIIALLEKLSRLKWLTGLTLAAFFTCIVASVFLMRNISLHLTTDPADLRFKDYLKYKVAKWSFLSAVGTLFLFVNIYLFGR